MDYPSLRACIDDLEKTGQLIRIKEETDPELEMASVQLRVFELGGPAILFENVKGTAFPAVSNLFGTMERTRFLFRKTWKAAEEIIRLKPDPVAVLKRPGRWPSIGMNLLKALPRKVSSGPVLRSECRISDLPMIRSWPLDGGPFVTLPQVFTEDPDKPGVMASNVGMYRIQLAGNEFVNNAEIGLHYQIHRGIGVHQTRYNEKGKPMPVSIFVGGPPAHSLAAVMPLPEGISELLFAGILGGRRFRYNRQGDFIVSADADFVITGYVHPGENKPEGPFGDHLGYYSLKHPFPLMKVHKVYHRKDAIWPFTVVGRPPQEDTFFGEIIHELTGEVLTSEIPGLVRLHAVDAAGVHPLLLATGKERYTPYYNLDRPQELLSIANRILGTGQLGLAKYVFIGQDSASSPGPANVMEFLRWMLERIDFSRDLHFHTKTTIDTLDYSGEGMNSGSKVVIAAVDRKLRGVGAEMDFPERIASGFNDMRLVMPGVAAVSGPAFTSYKEAGKEMGGLIESLSAHHGFSGNSCSFPLLIVSDDSAFTSASLNNFLWETFTRSNPSHDVYGVGEFTESKHWGCRGTLIIDARKKPHHAPALEKDPAVERRVDRLFAKGGSLSGLKS